MDTATLERDFLTLFEGASDAVFRHCLFKLSDRERAVDVTEEAFARTWEYLASGREVENLKAFVFRTANNLIIDHYRKKKESSLDAMAEYGFDPASTDHERIPEQAAGREALALVAQLGEDDEEVIMLRFVSDLSIGEIADIRKESENAVSVRIHRALKKLKEMLEYGTN